MKSTPRSVHMEAESDGAGAAGGVCVCATGLTNSISQHSWQLCGSCDSVLANETWAEEIRIISRLGP